ncbi:DUF3813 family protein [Pontibacillus litoralis]|uniref:DUF3813 family protein n=1 Tax=Pontibacillus litoralis TaxID=516703 RepID=UPI00056CC465|nr:DUF3813 family protein [Pontibacillus litoralis]
MDRSSNLFQQAVQAVSSITNRNGTVDQEELSVAHSCIEAAQLNASQEELEQLQQFKQQLKQQQK